MTRGNRLVVVGGGPAGLAAGGLASQLGMDVTLVEEQTKLGGQYFQGREAEGCVGSPRHFAAVGQNVKVLIGTAVIDAPAQGVLTVWNGAQGTQSLEYDALVLATGAVDRPVAVPGWTLPGVMTAGAASSLTRANGVLPGRRVAVAGSGAFLLSVADELSARGCQVFVFEATPFLTTAGGLPALLQDPETAVLALGYMSRLVFRRVPRRYGTMVTEILGDESVEAVKTQRVDANWRPIPGTEDTIEVDTVCLGFGFVPRLELPQLLGCRIRYASETSDFTIVSDAGKRTSQAGIYAAGELIGLGGKRTAVLDGQIAALTAAHDVGLIDSPAYSDRIQRLMQARTRVKRTSDWMARAYRPRPGLWSLAQPTTMLCRCEEVTIADASAALGFSSHSPKAVKTATRVGMGRCQGRICSTYLIEWLRARGEYRVPEEGFPWSVRPPLRPIHLGEWLTQREE